MKVEIVTKEEFESFAKEVLAELARLRRAPDPVHPWLKSFEVRKLLKISPGTLQRLRSQGILPFSRIGGTILYKYEDVKRLGDEGEGEG